MRSLGTSGRRVVITGVGVVDAAFSGGSAALGAFAEAAIAGGLDDTQATQLGEAVAGMERIARRRRHATDG